MTEEERIKLTIEAASRLAAGMLANPKYDLLGTPKSVKEYEEDTLTTSMRLAENLISRFVSSEDD